MTAIEKISKRAKQMQKSHPRTPWAELIQKASKEYNRGALGTTHKTAKKKVSKKKSVGRVHHAGAGSSAHAAQSVASHKAAIRVGLEGKLANLAVKRFKAVGVRAKKKVQKEITAVQKDLRKYC